MSAVGVLGGSFSPVHKGHLEVARTVVERGLVDEVWLMPCRRNPLKDGSTTMPDAERLRLLNKAADYYNGLMEREAVMVKDTELGMPEPSFTADTLRKLSVEYPGIELRLITGADSYINFNRWKEWRWIEANFRPIVYPRPG